MIWIAMLMALGVTGVSPISNRLSSAPNLVASLPLNGFSIGDRLPVIVDEVTFAQADLVPTLQDLTIEADRLNYNQLGDIVQGRGNVVIRQGEIEITGALGSYRQRSGQSVVSGSVTLKSQGHQWHAETLVGNHRQRSFLLEKDVVYRHVSGLELEAIAVIVAGNTGVATFTGPITARTTGWTATSDRAELTVSSLVLLNNVRIESADEATDKQVGSKLVERLEVELDGGRVQTHTN